MSRERQTPQQATLLDLLIDGFEKNDMLDGFHWRNLPMLDATSASLKFEELLQEAHRWKGAPSMIRRENDRRVAIWPDLELRQSGRGVQVRARAPHFDDWWHDQETWRDDPMQAVNEWVASGSD